MADSTNLDRESYTVRRFVVDHCAVSLGDEYADTFRRDLLRMLAEVRREEREACARLCEGKADAFFAQATREDVDAGVGASVCARDIRRRGNDSTGRNDAEAAKESVSVVRGDGDGRQDDRAAVPGAPQLEGVPRGAGEEAEGVEGIVVVRQAFAPQRRGLGTAEAPHDFRGVFTCEHCNRPREAHRSNEAKCVVYDPPPSTCEHEECAVPRSDKATPQPEGVDGVDVAMANAWCAEPCGGYDGDPLVKVHSQLMCENCVWSHERGDFACGCTPKRDNSRSTTGEGGE